jgi:acyl dehydratase
MPLVDSAIGEPLPIVSRTWESTDAILYALGVGAGAEDPSSELAFTTENSGGHEQRVLPGFSVILANHPDASVLSSIGEFDSHALVHGEQEFTVFRAIPPSGTVWLASTIEGIYDKGSGALVQVSVTGTDENGEAPLFSTRSSYFIRAEKGFGAQPKPAETRAFPTRDPDVVVDQFVRPDQALIYRLSGDRNPLHSDPEFAKRAGFPKPILHGLATHGFVARALAIGAADSEPERVTRMFARFSKPVFPGSTITTRIWVDGTDVMFQTLDESGDLVLDRGTAVVEAA